MMAKRPEERYQTPNEVVLALEPFCQGAAPSARADATPASSVSATPNRVRQLLRKVGTKTWLALAVVAVLATGVVTWRMLTPATLPVQLTELRIWVRRDNNDDQIVWRDLVTGGTVELEPRPISPPLGPKDDFRLAGGFNQPTYWYVIVIDTKGEVEVAATSEDRQAEVKFPVRDDRMVGPDPRDPAGNNVLLLVAGTVPPSDGTPLLQERLQWSGIPPATIPRRWAGDVRGFIETDQAAPSLPSVYVGKIQKWLPPGLELVHVIFLPTRR
jgi:hypothetical protein